MHNVSSKIAKTENPHTTHFKIHSKLHHTIHLTIHLNTRAILRWEFAARLKPGVKIYIYTQAEIPTRATPSTTNKELYIVGLAARRVTCKNDICVVYRMATPTFFNRQLMYRNAGAGRKGRAIEFVYTTYHNIECTIAAAIQICSCNPMAATTAQTHPTNNNLHTSTKRSTRSATPPRKPKKHKSWKNNNPYRNHSGIGRT